MDYCWCGIQAICQCVDCHTPMCGEHARQELRQSWMRWTLEAYSHTFAGYLDLGQRPPELPKDSSLRQEQLWQDAYFCGLCLCPPCRKHRLLGVNTAEAPLREPNWPTHWWDRAAAKTDVDVARSELGRFREEVDTEIECLPLEQIVTEWHRRATNVPLTNVARGALGGKILGHVFGAQHARYTPWSSAPETPASQQKAVVILKSGKVVGPKDDLLPGPGTYGRLVPLGDRDVNRPQLVREMTDVVERAAGGSGSFPKHHLP